VNTLAGKSDDGVKFLGEILDTTVAVTHAHGPKPAVGYFLRNLTADLALSVTLLNAPAWLEGHTVYRLLPGNFPNGFNYHFDGFAYPVQFRFGVGGSVSVKAKPYQSQAYRDMNSCGFFMESGTGPFAHAATGFCMTNPAVNPFPINGQLWLTIDNAWWGRVDPETLETLPGNVDVKSSVLSAHPACDHVTGVCYTSYPCGLWHPPDGLSMKTRDICVGIYVTHGEKDMSVVEVSKATAEKPFLVGHSHSPCLTNNFLVVKLDSFEMRSPAPERSGMLKYINQKMDNQWLVFDRRTNVSRIVKSDFAFVNNHLLNCREVGDSIIADTSPATDHYLDTYFAFNLAKEDRQWDSIMLSSRRCLIPIDPEGKNFTCEKLLINGAWDGLFDFPTFNPLYKGNPDSRWWYATAPTDKQAMWMNMVIKGDNQERKVVATFHKPGWFTTEANFIPRPGATEEDDGVLFSVMYNSNDDVSVIVLLDPKTLKMITQVPLGLVLPYHSHGVVCTDSKRCFANP